jgi:PEP-CTERM motif
MKYRTIKRFMASLGITIFAATTQAAIVSIDSLVASWENINPVSGISVSGNGSTSASMTWGSGPNGPAGYNFSTATTPITNVVPPTSPNFGIGTWTHTNNPISGTSLNSATLRLTAGISVDSVSQGTFDFLFDFTHEETPNSTSSGICANGGVNGVGVNINGCADIVDIAYNALSDSFLVGSTLFTLNIVPGSTHFETIEQSTNTFNIEANIASTTSVVPEPATVALFGLGLIGLGFLGTRQQLA